MEEVDSPSPPPPPSPQDLAQPMDLSHDKSGGQPSTTLPCPTSPGSSGMKSNHVGSVVLHGVSIVSLHMEGIERLCLAQISNTLLKDFSYNEIHNRRVALGITCVQCTPVQLEILRRAGAMPISSRRCGMITKREAERLVKSFLEEHMPPKLPDNFAFQVNHSCGWGCKGHFVPARYNSSRAKCIKCSFCSVFFSPNKFIFHFHRTPESKYRHPDAANFNSWRRHLELDYTSSIATDDLRHAWEDVKAMFNGGSRKRLLPVSSAVSTSSKSSCLPSRLAGSIDPGHCKRMRLDQVPERTSYPGMAMQNDHTPMPYSMPGFGSTGVPMSMLQTAPSGYPSVPMLPCPSQPDSLPRPGHNLSLLDMWRGARAGFTASGYPSPFGMVWPRNTGTALMPPAVKLQDVPLPNPNRNFLAMDFAISRRKNASLAMTMTPVQAHNKAMQSAFRPVGSFADQQVMTSLRDHVGHHVEDHVGDHVEEEDPHGSSDRDTESPDVPFEDDINVDNDLENNLTSSVTSSMGQGQSYNSSQVMFPGMEHQGNVKGTPPGMTGDKGDVRLNTDHGGCIGAEDTSAWANDKDKFNLEKNSSEKTLHNLKDQTLSEGAKASVMSEVQNNNSSQTEDRNTPSLKCPEQSADSDTRTSVMHMSKEELQAELLRMLTERTSAEDEYQRIKERMEEHSRDSQVRTGALKSELQQMQERIGEEIEQEKQKKLAVQKRVHEMRESLESIARNPMTSQK